MHRHSRMGPGTQRSCGHPSQSEWMILPYASRLGERSAHATPSQPPLAGAHRQNGKHDFNSTEQRVKRGGLENNRNFMDRVTSSPPVKGTPSSVSKVRIALPPPLVQTPSSVDRGAGHPRHRIWSPPRRSKRRRSAVGRVAQKKQTQSRSGQSRSERSRGADKRRDRKTRRGVKAVRSGRASQQARS